MLAVSHEYATQTDAEEHLKTAVVQVCGADRGKLITLDHAIRRYDISPIVKRCGTWVVTEYGIECLANYYPIKRERLGEPRWVKHMATHPWVDMEDFVVALETGRAYHKGRGSAAGHSPHGSNGARFAVLQRDGFRCQLCGATAKDGVNLEVDHKMPKSRGGSNRLSNLWTLCFSCNRGKAARLVELPE